MPESSNEKTIPVKVALRIRPLLPREIGDGCQECVTVTPGRPQVVIGNDKAFTYDYVYGTTAGQNDLYEKTVLPLLDILFKGYNATVLAYGQTGSGKTYSMGTSFTTCANSNNGEIQGVIPRVVNDMFEYMEKKKEETEFLLKCSFLEIHNEEIHDLLNPSSTADKIVIRENVEGGIKIAGLSELPVQRGEEMVQLLINGSAARATGSTAMNSTSSRSHAIFSIIIEQKDKTGDGDFRRAKFHLVDLAGSERAKRTNAQGERFKEGVNINKGLLALGNVISALSDENRKSNAHVPYRDSKLTRLLQDSLGGNSNTIMIACVSPADSNYEETLNTLRYADRARQIKNKPIVNRDPVAAEMAKLKQQVQMLQLQLIQGQTINGGFTEGNEMGLDLQEVVVRVQKLEEENLKLSHELHNSVNQNTTMFEKVLMAELARDKIVRQYDELRHYLTDHKVKLEPSLTETSAEANEETNLAAELQKKFHQFEESCTFSQTSDQHNDSQDPMSQDRSCEGEKSMDHDGSLPSSPVMDSSFESQHALRQAELGRQVQELTKALTLKQELAVKMQQTEGAMNERMVKQYEVTVRELESAIDKLENEKAGLSLALSAAKTATTTASDSSKSRLRIKELESKITEMKKKQVELQKLQRLKQQSDVTISKLNTEIHNVKSTRVKLMRQMKEESERFRNLKKEKEKEIMQLKQKDRKRQFEYTKLQNIHQKQQSVLKRKTEEASAANKRLHDALSKRKEASEKRDSYHNQQNKQSDNLIPRVKSWLSHEVEVLASITHAKKTLNELIEDRKTISHQLCELREQQETIDEPPAKKIFAMKETENKKPQESENEVKIKSIEAELKIKTSQIAELQKKLVDAETHVSSEKSKHRWNNIHTMAEAKASLQVLLTMAVDGKSKLIKTEKDSEGDRKDLEELRQNTETLVKKHRKQLDFLRCDYDKRETALQKEHEDKVLILLQQEKMELSRLQELIQTKDNELEEKRQESDMLRQRFVTLSEALSNETPSIIEDTETNDQDDDDMLIEEIENLGGDDVSETKDPDWIYVTDDELETPLFVKRTKSIVARRNSDNELEEKRQESDMLRQVVACVCRGLCKRGCNCRTNGKLCGEECQCKSKKCCNRPKDPKTPIFAGNSSESDSSMDKENDSPFVLIPMKLQLPSDDTKVLTSINSKATPKTQESHIFKVTPSQIPKATQSQTENSKATSKTQETKTSAKVSNSKKPQSRDKLTSSSSTNSSKSDKLRKIRRKSSVLSKKQGIKNSATSTTTTPHRAVMRTPVSGFTLTRIVKTPKLQSNGMMKKKNIDGKAKQRKRKLHNPSSLPPPFAT